MQTNHKTIVQTIIKAPLEKVWDALINPAIVKQYFFGSNLKSNWEVGSPIYFTGEYEGQLYEDKGIIQEYTANKSITYSYLSSWSNLEDKPENYLEISYHVELSAEGTQLSITQSNYDEERSKHSQQTWGVVIDGLKKTGGITIRTDFMI